MSVNMIGKVGITWKPITSLLWGAATDRTPTPLSLPTISATAHSLVTHLPVGMNACICVSISHPSTSTQYTSVSTCLYPHAPICPDIHHAPHPSAPLEHSRYLQTFNYPTCPCTNQVSIPSSANKLCKLFLQGATARVRRRVEGGKLPLFQGVLKVEVEEVALAILPSWHSLQGLLLKELQLAIRQQPTAEEFFQGIQGLYSTPPNITQAMDS
jgi:hypothetical protein